MIHGDLAKFTNVIKFKIFLKTKNILDYANFTCVLQLNFFSTIYLSQLISLGYKRARDWEWFF